uniref:Uncharacterized protein n=1 Tax=Anguilla anguilla TaxID=7936 RepID=A0A0E9TEV4_ANGAN
MVQLLTQSPSWLGDHHKHTVKPLSIRMPSLTFVMSQVAHVRRANVEFPKAE